MFLKNCSTLQTVTFGARQGYSPPKPKGMRRFALIPPPTSSSEYQELTGNLIPEGPRRPPLTVLHIHDTPMTVGTTLAVHMTECGNNGRNVCFTHVGRPLSQRFLIFLRFLTILSFLTFLNNIPRTASLSGIPSQSTRKVNLRETKGA